MVIASSVYVNWEDHYDALVEQLWAEGVAARPMIWSSDGFRSLDQIIEWFDSNGYGWIDEDPASTDNYIFHTQED